MGVYTAFLDAALGILSLALGLVAGFAGLCTVFLTSALLALCAAPIAARPAQRPDGRVMRRA